jgi:hypothetical protein
VWWHHSILVTAPILYCSDQVKPLRRDAKRHQQGRGYLQPDTYGKDRSIATSKITGSAQTDREHRIGTREIGTERPAHIGQQKIHCVERGWTEPRALCSALRQGAGQIHSQSVPITNVSNVNGTPTRQ